MGTQLEMVFRNQIKKGLMCNAKEFEFYPVNLSDSWNARELLKLPLAKSKFFFCWAYNP